MFKIKRTGSDDVVAEFQDSEGRDCVIEFFGADGCQISIGDGFGVFDSTEAVALANLILERLYS